MKTCSDCKHFVYDEYWDGENEECFMGCMKEHYDHVGFNTQPCDDFEEDE